MHMWIAKPIYESLPYFYLLVEEEGIARSMWDAPDIDGRIFVPTDLPVGEFVEVKITDWRGYDLIASK